MIPSPQPIPKILNAIQQRKFSPENINAFRLFNGFYEGVPGLVIDRYKGTLVIFNHNETGIFNQMIKAVVEWVMNNLTGMNAVLIKERQSGNKEVVNGVLVSGNSLAEKINEFGVTYAVNLQLNQDASFYLDTRNLRRWLLDHSADSRVLNTFAYTGSLGVAAGMGGASKVIQTDLNPGFLELGRQSWLLNDLDPGKCEIIPGDFFRVMGRLRHSQHLFECVILDPPYFSTTEAGKVDLQGDYVRLVNKVRPLVAHEGWLVVINNALFLSGQEFINKIRELCESPYLSFEEIIPVPPDVTGYPDTIVDPPPVEPAPFNHPTKIAVLKAFRKDKRK